MITIASSKAALVALLLALPIAAGAGQAATPKTQTNREGPVTVKVTPRNLSPDASTWDFEITLDTHAVSLDQDLSRAAVLVDGQGNARSPLAWEGDPPADITGRVCCVFNRCRHRRRRSSCGSAASVASSNGCFAGVWRNDAPRRRRFAE